MIHRYVVLLSSIAQVRRAVALSRGLLNPRMHSAVATSLRSPATPRPVLLFASLASVNGHQLRGPSGLKLRTLLPCRPPRRLISSPAEESTTRESTLPDHVEMPMPRLVPSMAEGVLSKWLIAEGDYVDVGELV